MELIHIECGTFNGIANFKIGNKVIRFGLCTPTFNDYGECRVDTDFNLLPYIDAYKGFVPEYINPIINLTDEEYNWWINCSEELSSDDMGQVCGGKDENGDVLIYTDRNKFELFTIWKEREHTPCDEVMFNVLAIFMEWYYKDGYKNKSGVLIYPDLS
jgi:hypothetical protein